MWLIAATAFAAIFWAKAPFPLIIVAAGLVGLAGGLRWPEYFLVIKGHGAEPEIQKATALPAKMRTVKILLIGLVIWWLPVAALWPHETVRQEGIFFSKAAVVTFGGAYAVLPYVAQHAVEQYHWLDASQMMDGLGLAETTPGPLIMVVQFVGFLGGWNHAGNLSPLAAATLGSALTTWVTFVPSILWILLGAPYVERLRGHHNLSCALSAITAAVVGVVLNLAVWFGWQTIVPPSGTINWFAVVVGLVAFLGMWKLKWDAIPVIAGCGAIGLAWSFI
jgi:chromate transporter